MALGGKKSGSAVFLSGSGHSVVRFSAQPGTAFILGRCGRCGRESDCKKLSFGGAMSTLDGEFICECGARVMLSVSLGFKKTSGF